MSVLGALRDRLEHPEPLFERLADEMLLPLLGRHYHESGLKVRTGRLLAGVSQRGATGNYIIATAEGVRVGVNTEEVPHALYAIRGRGPVRPVRARALRYDLNGRTIYSQYSKPAPPHAIYYVTASEQQQATSEFIALLKGNR